MLVQLTSIIIITNKRKTKWYTKRTSSSRHLNYNSNHTEIQKFNVIAPECRNETLKQIEDSLLDIS